MNLTDALLKDALFRHRLDAWVRDELPLLLFIHKERKPSNKTLRRRALRDQAHIQRTMMRPAVVKWLRLLGKAVLLSDPNWKAQEKAGKATMRPAIHSGLTYGAEQTVKRHELRKQEFDPMGDAAVDWTNKHTAELVTSITAEAKVAVATFTRQMVQAGLTAQETARTIRAVVPLLPQHATAVGTALTKMLDKGVPFDRALKRAERYAQKLHNYRTKMIARTESSFAQTEGQRQGYKTMGVKKLERIEDPACCDICDAAQGQIYTIDGAQGILPEHPQCEGTWVAAT